MADAVNNKSLNEIAKKILFQAKHNPDGTEKQTQRTDEELVLVWWEAILSKYDSWDKFHKKIVKLTQMNSDINAILAHLKNPPPPPQYPPPSTKNFYDQFPKDKVFT